MTSDVEQLVAVCGDAVVISDRTGVITLWNAGAERMFGFSQADAVGQTLDIIIPERFRKRHWDGCNATLQSGNTRYGNDLLKVPALTKDGRTISIAFSIALLRAPDGSISGMASIIRDESVRFKEDRELRKQLAELKAKAGG